MYSYIMGKVTEVTPTYITLENNQIGYKVIVASPFNFHIGEDIKLYIYHYVCMAKDINSLYGFINTKDRDLFISLINVTGIGPKSALSMEAYDSYENIIYAINSSNTKYLTKFPGIGVKSASQIILDLKGKLEEIDGALLNNKFEDALLALQALGYSKTDCMKYLKQVDTSLSTEDAIKMVLKNMIGSKK